MRDIRDTDGGGRLAAGTPAASPSSAAAAGRTASGGERAPRAAMFAPFAALRGYYEMILEQERVPEERHEPTEEEAEALSRAVARARRGTIVRAVHYDRDAYVETVGCVARVDPVGRVIEVVDAKIAFDDLRELEIVEEPGGRVRDGARGDGTGPDGTGPGTAGGGARPRDGRA